MVPKLEERFPQIIGSKPTCSPHRVDWPKDKFGPAVASLQVGKLTINCFTFWDAGNVLGLHSHPPGKSHVTFVNAGRLRIFGEGWERIVEKGDRLIFDPDFPHAYEALEPMSQITNIVY